MSIPKLYLHDLAQAPNLNDQTTTAERTHKRNRTLRSNEVPNLKTIQASFQLPTLQRTIGADLSGRISPPPPPNNKTGTGSLGELTVLKPTPSHERVALEQALHDIPASARSSIDINVNSLTLSDEKDKAPAPLEVPPPPKA